MRINSSTKRLAPRIGSRSLGGGCKAYVSRIELSKWIIFEEP
jgi:hypothetical protein